MGQYHFPCNLDRREYLCPWTFDDGCKLMEFGASGNGTMAGLALLLASSNGSHGRGGGDWHAWVEGVGHFTAGIYGAERTLTVDTETAERLAKFVPGRWAGERIAIIGDYAELGDPGGIVPEDSPWADEPVNGSWTDISTVVVDALRLDYYTREQLKAPRDPSQLAALHEDGSITSVRRS